MLTFSRRLSTLVLALAVVASNAVLCASSMPTPEARMACCADGDCPMHKSHSSHSSDTPSARALSQAEADNCCAVSEQDNSAPSASTFVVSIGLALAPSPIPLDVPATPVRPDGRLTLVRTPGIPVPAHLLLSVFLV